MFLFYFSEKTNVTLTRILTYELLNLTLLNKQTVFKSLLHKKGFSILTWIITPSNKFLTAIFTVYDVINIKQAKDQNNVNILLVKLFGC
jgi:hypothetical protein